MRDTGETILVAILGMIGLELIDSWVGVVVAFFSILFIIFRLFDMRIRNKREQEKRREEREKHELDMQLLKKELNKKNN